MYLIEIASSLKRIVTYVDTIQEKKTVNEKWIVYKSDRDTQINTMISQ